MKITGKVTSSSRPSLSHLKTILWLFYTVTPFSLGFRKAHEWTSSPWICSLGSPSPPFYLFIKYVLTSFESKNLEKVRKFTWKAFREWKFKTVLILIYLTLKNQTKTPKKSNKKIMTTFLKAVSSLTNNTELVEVLIAEEAQLVFLSNRPVPGSPGPLVLQRYETINPFSQPFPLRLAVINAVPSEQQLCLSFH